MSIRREAVGSEAAGPKAADSARSTVTSARQSPPSATAGATSRRTFLGSWTGHGLRHGDTFFHNGPLGLSAKSTGGTDMGFNREPRGTLNSMAAGGKAYLYLTDALGSVEAEADESGTKVNTYDYSPCGFLPEWRGGNRESSTPGDLCYRRSLWHRFSGSP